MKIGVIKGDGIGPEIVDEAMKVLDQTAKVYGHSISYTQLLMGGASIDVNGVPLTEETLQLAKDSDAVLMGCLLYTSTRKDKARQVIFYSSTAGASSSSDSGFFIIWMSKGSTLIPTSVPTGNISVLCTRSS